MAQRFRDTDPVTSREAAERVAPSIPTTRERVRTILSDAGADGLTHDQMIREHRLREALSGWPSASESSLRTRCSELARDGEVEAVSGRVGRSTAGNRSVFWRAVPVYEQLTIDQELGMK